MRNDRVRRHMMNIGPRPTYRMDKVVRREEVDNERYPGATFERLRQKYANAINLKRTIYRTSDIYISVTEDFNSGDFVASFMVAESGAIPRSMTPFSNQILREKS